MHYGFEMRFCNPDSGNEKGNVENKVGTFRRNVLVPEAEIEDLESYSKELLKRCEIFNKDLHYIEKIPIQELFEAKKKKMRFLNKK